MPGNDLGFYHFARRELGQVKDCPESVICSLIESHCLPPVLKVYLVSLLLKIF
jgi:hypothetical protein